MALSATPVSQLSSRLAICAALLPFAAHNNIQVGRGASCGAGRSHVWSAAEVCKWHRLVSRSHHRARIQSTDPLACPLTPPPPKKNIPGHSAHPEHPRQGGAPPPGRAAGRHGVCSSARRGRAHRSGGRRCSGQVSARACQGSGRRWAGTSQDRAGGLTGKAAQRSHPACANKGRASMGTIALPSPFPVDASASVP